jgi:hypothetical protein
MSFFLAHGGQEQERTTTMENLSSEEGQPDMTHETEPGMTHESEPGMTHESQPG